MIDLTQERDLETLRQVSLLLDRENQRLITRTLQLTTELARLRGVADPEQLALAELRALEQTRAQVLQPPSGAPTPAASRRPARPGHGPRPQLALPVVEIRHALPPDARGCPACGGELTEMAGQTETSERITTIKLTYQVEHHVRQKYRCACNGAVVTAPGPAQVRPGSRYAPEFGVGVAVAKYADHLPLERQVRMMARDGLLVESQTLWDQLNAIARHLEPTYEALGRRALDAPVINVDETRWAIMGSPKPAAGTVWGVRSPTVAFYRILPGKSADEGRQVLAGYRGIAVVDGFAVYDVLARDGPGFTLAHCWAHTKRKFEEIASQWPVACAEIDALIGELYAGDLIVGSDRRTFVAEGMAWRVSRSQENLALSSTRFHDGRWHKQDRHVFYMASSLSLAIFEAVPPDLVASLPTRPTLYAARINFPPRIEMSQVELSVLAPEWKSMPPPDWLREVGDGWYRRGATCILAVPSARAELEVVYLVNMTHPRFPEFTFARVDPLSLAEL